MIDPQDDGKPDGGFTYGNDDRKQSNHLTIHLVRPLSAECYQVEIGGIQHEFSPNKYQDHIPPGNDDDNAQAKQE
jgi:hypothetical protein